MTSQVSRNIVRSEHQNYSLLLILNFGIQEDVFIRLTLSLYFFKQTIECFFSIKKQNKLKRVNILFDQVCLSYSF